jgi:hypothetical protein
MTSNKYFYFYLVSENVKYKEQSHLEKPFDITQKIYAGIFITNTTTEM